MCKTFSRNLHKSLRRRAIKYFLDIIFNMHRQTTKQLSQINYTNSDFSHEKENFKYMAKSFGWEYSSFSVFYFGAKQMNSKGEIKHTTQDSAETCVRVMCSMRCWKQIHPYIVYLVNRSVPGAAACISHFPNTCSIS